jgi:hypothetical protein
MKFLLVISIYTVGCHINIDMAYKGRWTPTNRKKYDGNPGAITYRSLWERQAFKWCDSNPDIKSWSSESVIVPYRSAIDRKNHRYFVDLLVTYNTGETVLVEIKPKKQTNPPKKPKNQTRRYITEMKTYSTNLSKWQAATNYAADRGWVFQIWTEETLADLGIKLINPGRKKARRKRKVKA